MAHNEVGEQVRSRDQLLLLRAVEGERETDRETEIETEKECVKLCEVYLHSLRSLY